MSTMASIHSPHLRFLRHRLHDDINKNGSIRSISSSNSNNSLDSNNSNNSSSSNSPTSQKKKTASQCVICGKRLLKLAKWRNYLILPCKCQHTFCKHCITERLQCRQKVMGQVSYDLMWTFPCPGSAQCGQALTVDWSRGRRYSKNLVASDLNSSDDSWEQEEEVSDVDMETDVSACSGHQYHDVTSVLREIG